MAFPKVGDKGFFRGTTRDDYLGEVVSVDAPFTVSLKDASWVAESGIFHTFIKEGKADGMELEYIGLLTVTWTAWIPWNSPLPTKSV